MNQTLASYLTWKFIELVLISRMLAESLVQRVCLYMMEIMQLVSPITFLQNKFLRVFSHYMMSLQSVHRLEVLKE